MAREGLQAGEIFARDYEVLRPLAAGGMGAVYVAKQLSTKRERALKIIHADIAANPALRARFVQEARVGASIESAHVVEVIAAGVEDDGTAWLAMEALQGQTLEDHASARGPLSADEVLGIFKQLTHALSAAHDKGIVHRDLKPENIFLGRARRVGATHSVKLLDFGIAKFLADATQHNTTPIGTPAWMAPEQTRAGTVIGPPTDVWALGLIAFRLLVGRPFWRAANTDQASLRDLLREVLETPIPRASDRAAELGGAAPFSGFDTWFARSVTRHPDQRYRDAKECFNALVDVLGPLAASRRAKDKVADAATPHDQPRATNPAPDARGNEVDPLAETQNAPHRGVDGFTLAILLTMTLVAVTVTVWSLWFRV